MNEARPTAAVREKTSILMDLVVLGAFVALFFSISKITSEWRLPLKDAAPVDLSLAALPKYALFSFARLQIVCDLVRYLQNSMLMPSSPSPAYRRYVISSDTCRTTCSRPLLLHSLTGGM